MLSPHAFYSISAVVLAGTAYSIVYNTYLDTSDPLIGHLPHPLSGTHSWANSRSPLNLYLVKQAWSWTSMAHFLAWSTGPRTSRSVANLTRYVTATLWWIFLTVWFFGPPIFERIVLATGGQCVLTPPLAPPMLLPLRYCLDRSLFSLDMHLMPSPVSNAHRQRTNPRLRGGHDASGHVFLLTMSILLLVQQILPIFALSRWSKLQWATVVFNAALIVVWLFASGVTSIYFHCPLEKLTGYCEVTCYLSIPIS
ncbi:inositol phospholipid synthesis and fat-storage-inducing TM-domain-containing protein [Favolaschia claudopus]|uniref:Inositol phospholipid synthesis and fat-storage-inducing TM-domain-containing protein n=1 Tax=Favolaschia claudopus TaxID=2862362 RepID=A0AAW0BE36_9AGAR